MSFVDDVCRTESSINPDLLVRLDHQARTLHAILGLQTEIGELVDPIKRHIFYGTPLDRPNIKEEIGDCLYYLGLLCDVYGVQLEDCMAAVIRKLKVRYPGKFDARQAVNRDLAAERKALD